MSTPKLELNFINFFQDLIFHPDHAKEKDENKALLATVLLGIFTLGIAHLLVGVGHGIYQLGYYAWDQYNVSLKKKKI